MSELTIASFFTKVGETVAGLLTGAVNVFTGLWESGVPGQVICTMGFASTVIALGCAIFKISKRSRRK